MGKNWKGGGRGGGRGGGGGGGGDLASCRGYAAVIGTCDAAREKESNKELSNLLNQAIEQLYPPIQEKPQEDTQESSNKHESIEDMLRSEVLQVKQQKKSGQDVMSINIGIKGIVFAKINRRDVCPVKLVKSIMDRVKEEKVPCSRHLVKIIPLQLVYFAGETDLINTARLFVEGTFISTDGKTLPQLQLSKVQHKRKAPELSSTEEEQVHGEDVEVSEKTHEEGESVKKVCTETNGEVKESLPESALPVDAVPASTTTDVDVPTITTPTTTVDVPVPPPLYNGPEVRYFILFKARNHNTLNKTTVIQRMRESMPVNIRQDYMNGQVKYSPICTILYVYILYVYLALLS